MYERWIELKKKNEDYATSLRAVLPELDDLITHHGLDKVRTEKYNELEQNFSKALSELKEALQKLCEQPVSPIRRKQVEPALSTVHESYLALYGFSTDPQEATKQQYQAVLDLESYLALLDQAYPNDILENGDFLVSSLAIVARIEKQTNLFTSLPQYTRQLALEAIKRLAEEQGWPQQLYAAKAVLAALNDQFSSTSVGDITSPWGEQAWQNKQKGLQERFVTVLNTDQLQELAKEVSSLSEWEKKLVDLRQRLKWADHFGSLKNWRNSIVTASPEHQAVDFISQALQEAIDARIEIADKVSPSEVAALYEAQTLLSQRIINQFNQQLPQTVEKLRGAADSLKATAPQFKAIAATLSQAYQQFSSIPRVISDTNDLSERINARTTALSQLQMAWDGYRLQQIRQHPELGNAQNWPKIKAEVEDRMKNYALISEARDNALGLLIASANVSELAQAAQIELASLYIALGSQAVRNFNKTDAQQYLEVSQKIVEGLPQADNQYVYSLLKKLQDGVEWLQRYEEEGDIKKLAQWRDAVYAENSTEAKEVWEQLEKQSNADELLSGWVVIELAERQMGLPRVGVTVYTTRDSSAETEEVFDLFLQLFDLIKSKSDAEGFTLYGHRVKSFAQFTADHGARFTLDNQAIFLDASEKGLEEKSKIAGKLKKHRLTYEQGVHLQAWLVGYERHQQTRQIIKMAFEELVSTTLEEFVRNEQKATKIKLLTDHIESMASLKKHENDLPLTRTTKEVLQRAVDQIVTKFASVPSEAKSAQGELKRRLSACQKWLGKLDTDNSYFPQLSAQTRAHTFSDRPTATAYDPYGENSSSDQGKKGES